jgi:hypothetical protein
MTPITNWEKIRYGDILDANTIRNRPTKTAKGMSKTAKQLLVLVKSRSLVLDFCLPVYNAPAVKVKQEN